MSQKFKDNVRVLVHGDMSKLDGLMSRHFFNQLVAVSPELTQVPYTIRQLNDHVKRGQFTHVVIPDEHFHALDESYTSCKVPVVELLGDHFVPWAIQRKKNYIRENGIKDVFVFSNRFLDPYTHLTNCHPVLVGYDAETFKDEGKERDIDILVSGSLGQDTHRWVYPVRNWLADVVPEIGVKEGLKVKVKQHPGYFPTKQPKKGYAEEYAGLLNRSKIAIGGSSHWRLLLKKLLEIPACGTILLSDLPVDDSGFFKNRILEVDPEKIDSSGYVDVVRRRICTALENYNSSKARFQPFRTEQDRFDRSYKGRALEMRAILAQIK